MPNLISTYVNNLNKPVVQPQKNNKSNDVELIHVKREKPDFDIHRELANRTFIKPLPARAHLVKNRIFDAPAVFVKDAVYDVKALKDGWKGDANDHQLGKLNDLGMKLGGLGIAAYLFTKRQTPTTKAMEFIGFGTFFASMALWPKLALQLPAKLIHGFDVMPQYEDSFGRKKPLYQDPQFIPWDAAYSDKEIHKLGDRWNIPKDIPNRRDFIQEKMRKIALQNNTLWMLTAGFATPVMSALMCNALDKPTTKLLDKYSSKKADKMLVSFSEYAARAKDDRIETRVNSLIEISKDKIIDKNMIHSFAKALGEERDVSLVKAIETDLTHILIGSNRTYALPEKVVVDMLEGTKASIAERFGNEVAEALVPKKADVFERWSNPEVIRKLNVNEKNPRFNKIIGGTLYKDELSKLVSDIDDMVRVNIREYNKKASADKQITPNREAVILRRILGDGSGVESGAIGRQLVAVPASVLDDDAVALLKSLSKTMTDFTAKGKVLDKYAFTKFGATSNLANYWNDVDKSILKAVGFSDSDLKLIKDDRKLVTPMLIEKLEKIASDGNAYKETLEKICQKVARLGETIKDDMVSPEYKELTAKVYEETADKFRNLKMGGKDVNMSALIKQLVGFDALLENQRRNPHAKAYSLKDIQTSFAEARLLGVRSSFDRVINALDFFRRAATNTNMGTIYDGKNKIPAEVVEELIDSAKKILADAHMADYETKFFTFRNPKYDKIDTDDVTRAKDGKIIPRHFGKTVGRKVDLPSDAVFFNNLMRMMYENGMHDETRKLLTKYNIQEMDDFRSAMLHDVGDVDYFAKKFHKLYSAFGNGSKATSENKFNRIGKSFTDLIYDAATQKYNTKSWMKIFGTAGGVLLGVTVLSQFFFGKLPLPKENNKG